MKTKNPEDLTRALKKRLKQIQETQLKIGIPKEETGTDSDGNTTYLADIAFENNYGSKSKNIPARRFGTTTVPRYEEKINKVVKLWLGDAVEGRLEVADAFDRIGFTTAGYMKKNLTQGEWKGNAEYTIKKKGSDQPLIDTGQLRQSITWLTENVK